MILEEKKIKIQRFMQTHLHKTINEVQEEIYKQAAIRFYQKKVLSLGKAAELAEMTKIEFIDFLRYNDEIIFDYDDNLLSEINADAKLIVEKYR